MNKSPIYFTLALLALFLLGCPSTKETKKEEAPPPPPAKPVAADIVIQVGSLDLAKLSRKIETSDIEQLTTVLKRSKVDILTMHGITRYPGLKDRIDVVDELSRQTGMRQAFGENLMLNGRQTGNAVFSSYPIQSSANTPYSGIQSMNFESALQTIVDCGARSVVVVATRLPDKASVDDQTTCINLLNSFNTLYLDDPIIIAGNLPGSGDAEKIALFDEARMKGQSPAIWFSRGQSLKLTHVKTENTQLGPLIVAEFGIFRKPQP
ncbi:MAG: hypothetical protein ABSF91_11780 [Bacteroidota bacterium]|jgi:hypothetical protein